MSETKENKGQKALRIILIVFVIGTLLVTIMVHLITYLYGFDAMVAGHNAARPYLALWRLLLFVIIVGGWNRWMAWLTNWADLTPQQHALNVHYRWRFALWLIVIEAFLVQNLLGTLLGAFPITITG